MSKSFNIKETANTLGVTTATVLNWEKQGHISSYKINNKSIYRPAEVLHLKSLIESGEVKRLNTRANKKNSTASFIPEEYLGRSQEAESLRNICDYITANKINIRESIFVISLNFLIRNKILAGLPFREIIKFYNKQSGNENIRQELNKWQHSLDFKHDNDIYQPLLDFELPDCDDPLGTIYQSLISEGEKSRNGSYFTPAKVASEMAGAYLNQLHGNVKILDLCCGTGQFLMAAGKQIKKMGRLLKPDCLWGYDTDPMAVQIARINLMVLFRDFDFSPNVFNRNLIYNYSLDDKIRKNRKFDLVLGNPPWGAEFRFEQLSFLKTNYPEILSMESFSYFVFIGLNMLREGGILSYLLPESVLNIKTHKDIRSYILHNCEVLKITSYSRLFSKVFTPVVRIDLHRKKPESFSVTIEGTGQNHTINVARFMKNEDMIFDIHNTNEDYSLLRKIFSRQHSSLKGHAGWALGIVTGNNDHFLSTINKKGYYKILKGTEIQAFRISKASHYIHYDPEKLQQASPLNKFRTPEKLIYKFISSKLVFAWDDKQHLTLNSANVLIPQLEGYPMKAIAALFNSALYQFIFKRKYFTHKVLRSHIENLPLPLLDTGQLNSLSAYYDKLNLASYDDELFLKRYEEFNRFVFGLFDISPEESELIYKRISA